MSHSFALFVLSCFGIYEQPASSHSNDVKTRGAIDGGYTSYVSATTLLFDVDVVSDVMGGGVLVSEKRVADVRCWFCSRRCARLLVLLCLGKVIAWRRLPPLHSSADACSR